MTELINLLPKRTAELVELIGFDAAMILVKEFGGTHLNIPKNPKPTHRLVDVIGFIAFEKLCRYYGGGQLEIDLCANLLNKQKQRLILNGVAQGKTNAQLAREFRTTERQIRRIKQLHHYAEPVVNLDVFEL